MNKNKIFIIIFLIIFSLLGFSCGTKEPQDIGVFKSTDDGETWEQKVKIDEKNNISQVSVNKVVIDDKNPNVLYIGTMQNGIYKSSDSGETWNQTSLNFGDIYSIAVNPQDNSVLYAAGSLNNIGKIFKSLDEGNNWEEVYAETHAGTPVYSVEIDWYDPRKVYAGTGLGAVLKSKDSGRSWIVSKWFDDEILEVLVSPKDSRIIFAHTNNELYKSSDESKSFFSIEKNIIKNEKIKDIHDLAIHEKFPDIIYLSSGLGLFRSENNGKSWSEIQLLLKPEPRSLSNIALDDSNPQKIYFGFDANFYKSEDGGRNWSVKQFTTGKIGSIAVSSDENNIIYVGAKRN